MKDQSSFTTQLDSSKVVNTGTQDPLGYKQDDHIVGSTSYLSREGHYVHTCVKRTNRLNKV